MASHLVAPHLLALGVLGEFAVYQCFFRVLTRRRKSQLAIHYAHRVRHTSPQTWVFWVHAGTRERFQEAYRGIADKLRLPRRNDAQTNVLKLVADWLVDEENGMWLMILDNADDMEVFYPKDGNRRANQEPLNSFVPMAEHGAILVTSRSRDVAERLVGDQSNIRDVGTMSDDEALRLLQVKLNNDPGQTQENDLIRALGNVPLAISQAAAYIKRRAPRMSISVYLYEFRKSAKRRDSLLGANGIDLWRDPTASNSIASTWQITFEQIRRDRPSAADLLSFMSFFKPQDIPESALIACRGESADEVRKREFEEDIAVLRAYSLVTETREGDVFEMHMHTLVQSCTQVWLSSSGGAQHWKSEFLRVMARHYPNEDFQNWARCEKLGPHVESIIRKKPEENDDENDAENWAELATKIGSYRWQREKYSEAEPPLRQAAEIRQRLKGPEARETLASLHILALVLVRKGEHEKAEQILRQVLLARKKNLGREHLDTLRSLHDLAYTLREQGKYKEAEQIIQQALGISERLLGSEHPDTLASLKDLATTPGYQGKYKEEEQMHRQTLEIRGRVLGREHPDTFYSLNNLILTMQNQGKYKEAEQMHRQALEMEERVLGKEHHETLIRAWNLAILCRKTGRVGEATAFYERATSGLTRALGSSHPDTQRCVEGYRSFREELAADDQQSESTND